MSLKADQYPRNTRGYASKWAGRWTGAFEAETPEKSLEMPLD
ncbi:MAG TPA: hypothetical protein PK767_03900 [Clostridiales bacterium]|nr:hypothetical protein [Clostridiales bacterium]HPP35373.1 hypothetical protein [Clostridiales bacterium]